MAKPAALLVHSIGGNATNWDPVLAELRDLFAANEVDGRIHVLYTTELYYRQW